MLTWLTWQECMHSNADLANDHQGQHYSTPVTCTSGALSEYLF